MIVLKKVEKRFVKFSQKRLTKNCAIEISNFFWKIKARENVEVYFIFIEHIKDLSQKRFIRIKSNTLITYNCFYPVTFLTFRSEKLYTCIYICYMLTYISFTFFSFTVCTTRLFFASSKGFSTSLLGSIDPGTISMY